MSSDLVKRGQFWHYAFSLQGVRHRGSTKQSDKALARAVLNQLKSRLDRAAVYGAAEELTFSEAASLYLQKNRADVKLIDRLVKEIGPQRLAALKPAAFTDLAWRLYPKGKPATKNRNVLAPCSAVINHAAARGLAAIIRIPLFKVTVAPKEAGSKDWLAAFQTAARADGNPYLAAIARFMFETAARIGQSADLEWDQLNLREGCADIKTRKTGADGPEFAWRRAWLTPAMTAEIANLPRRHPRKVFGYESRHTASKAWDRLLARHPALQKLTRHEAGRHGFFTETIVRQGMDVVTASDLGGITPALALKRYAHAEEQRAKILKAFGGK